MFFYVAKCLDDNEDELDDLSKLTPTPIGADSSELSTTPIEETHETEPVEAAQDALALLNVAKATVEDDNTTNPPAEAEKPVEATPPADGSTKERRASHTWKGFKFKKQLSKVDLKIKNTFANQTERIKRNSIFHINTQGLEAQSETSPEEEPSVVPPDEGGIPQIREPETIEKSENAPNRPTDLNLFENATETPPRPDRRKDRKRFSLEKQTPRDARLLSVPNIKYQNVAKDSKKSKPTNNQAFFSLIKRLSKFFTIFQLYWVVSLSKKKKKKKGCRKFEFWFVNWTLSNGLAKDY